MYSKHWVTAVYLGLGLLCWANSIPFRSFFQINNIQVFRCTLSEFSLQIKTWFIVFCQGFIRFCDWISASIYQECQSLDLVVTALALKSKICWPWTTENFSSTSKPQSFWQFVSSCSLIADAKLRILRSDLKSWQPDSVTNIKAEMYPAFRLHTCVGLRNF